LISLGKPFFLAAAVAILLGGGLAAGATEPAVTVVETIAPSDRTAQPAPLDDDGYTTWLVQFSEDPLPRYLNALSQTSARRSGRLDTRGPAALGYLALLEELQQSHLQVIGNRLAHAPELRRTYRAALNGVALRLTPAETAKVEALPEVISVERDSVVYTSTDLSPDWLGASDLWSGAAAPDLIGSRGEGVIVGIIDTGINMQHPSFSPTDAESFTHTNPLGEDNYLGWCDPASPNHRPEFQCNSKLIGAWDFADESWADEDDGPEDSDGHGSHVASTAAGNRIQARWPSSPPAYQPMISGIAPRANLVAYDVCNFEGACFNTDIVAAIEQAILDGVDVINESLSIGGNAFSGMQQRAELNAVRAGIVSVRATGNSGSSLETIGPEPAWTISVAATSNPGRDFSEDGATVTPDPSTADRVAFFSSRGPADPSLGSVIKPDLAASGLSILAAINREPDAPETYGLKSGTSMASPHVAGAAALLRAVHPGWSPAEIRSVLMGTAEWRVEERIDGSLAIARPLSAGSGRIALDRAALSGLAMHESAEIFEAADPATGGEPATLNLASLHDRLCPFQCAWQRSFRSAATDARTWQASYQGAGNLQITPSTFTLEPGAAAVLDFDLELVGLDQDEWHFGRVILTNVDGNAPDFTLPLAVFSPSSTSRSELRFSADNASPNPGDIVTFQIDVSPADGGVTSLVNSLPDGLTYISGSATGGLQFDSGNNALTWSEQLEVPTVGLERVENPRQYRSLRGRGLAPIECGADCDQGDIGRAGLDFNVFGENFDTVKLSVNGTIVPGPSGPASGDQNLELPDPSMPLNLFAPLWTDLDLGRGGDMFAVNLLSGNGDSIFIFEWEDVALAERTGAPADVRFTFQALIEAGTDNISFVYGPMNWGAWETATAGAQGGEEGNGTSWFFNGTGTRPQEGQELKVTFQRDQRTFTYQARVDAPAPASLVNRADLEQNGKTRTAWSALNVTEVNPQPELTLVKTGVGPAEDFFAAGNRLYYTFEVTNTGNVPLNGPVQINDDLTEDEFCPPVNSVGDEDSALDPEEMIVCTASYAVTQADIDRGRVSNNASAVADGIESNVSSIALVRDAEIIFRNNFES